ncbi:MAG: HDOD domain-containing protein [Sulfuricellaceae bacterium]|nr:HDOD domain-containing protein [Sulfuricellaceae bacterium]
MAFGKLFKRLLGVSEKAAISDDPFGSHPPRKVASPAVPIIHEQAAIVQRDEILDSHSRIAGYRFTVQKLDSNKLPDTALTISALRADNLAIFAERRLALVPLTIENWKDGDFQQFIAPNTTFLVSTPSTGSSSVDWIQTIQEIKAAGGRVALDDAGATNPAAMTIANLMLLDFRSYSLENLERLAKRVIASHPSLSLAVDGISTWPEHRLCQSWGVRYSLGGFATANDEEDKSDKLNQSRLVLLEMLNLLRCGADLSRVSEVSKRDPGVAVKIVEMANSPIMGLTSHVASLEQAMMVLGRETLYRWLSVSMFRTGNTSGRDAALLELALWRAHFLELLASEIRPKQECDELFLVGLLSLLDILFGMSMDHALKKMNLPEVVTEVLLKSAGPYAQFLMLTMAMEKGRGEQVVRIAADLGIAPEKLEQHSGSARIWVEAALNLG